jgi:hypothetical protein
MDAWILAYVEVGLELALRIRRQQSLPFPLSFASSRTPWEVEPSTRVTLPMMTIHIFFLIEAQANI